MKHTLTTNDIMRIASIISTSARSAHHAGDKVTAKGREELAMKLAAVYDDAIDHGDATIKVVKEGPIPA
jgi:hypothetical protein